MTYEDLIVSIDNEAPNLSDIAYKLLWRLVSLAIQRCSPEVRVSHNWLAQQLGLSREGVARGARDLRKFITIDARNGYVTTFTLPASWLSPQRAMFSGDEPLIARNHLPISQAGSCQLPRQVPANAPGTTCLAPRHHLPTTQAPPAWEMSRVANVPGTTCLDPRQGPTENQQLTDDFLIDIESNQNPAAEQFVHLIDRSLASVEIDKEKQADAAVLSDHLYAYKCDFGPMQGRSLYPDGKVLARCLALAPVDRLVSVLRTLRSNHTRCGKQDMWFFTVFAQRIYGIPPRLTADRYDLLKPRQTPKPSYESKPSLFQEDLLQRTAARLRRLA